MAKPLPDHSELERLRELVKDATGIAHAAMDSEREWCAQVEQLRHQLRGAEQALEDVVIALAEQGYNGRDEALKIGRKALDRLANDDSQLERNPDA